MLQIIRIISFYIILPLSALLWLFFIYTIVSNTSTLKHKWQNLGGILGGLLISCAVMIFDLSFKLSAQLPPETLTFLSVAIPTTLATVIGFSTLLIVGYLNRKGMIPLMLMFILLGLSTSLYYLISLSQLRYVSSFSIIGFAVGCIVYLVIYPPRLIYLLIALFSPTYNMLKEENVVGDNANSSPMSSEILINGDFSGDVILGDIAGRDVYSTNDSHIHEWIKIIGSSDGHKQTQKAHEVYTDLKKILNEIGKKYFKISVGHPKLISKGYESPFVVQLYFEELTNTVKMKIKEIVGENYTERVYDTELKLGQIVKIKLFSPDITFPEAIAKKLESSINLMTFLGKPLDTCQPREHKVVLSILDNKTGIEYQSETFSVKVADYAFDHVSRPLLSKVSAVVLGIGSFTMFILALLEQIDKTIGLTSGTAAGVLAMVVYTNFYNLYQRIRPNTP